MIRYRFTAHDVVLIVGALALVAVTTVGTPGCEPEHELPAGPAAGAPWETVQDLSGTWGLQLGDLRLADLDAQAEAATWEPVAVPGAWEDGGFWGYDGLAWYRTTFRLDPQRLNGRPLYLRIGRVDDADEVYLNGRFLGSTGRMPPVYETAYHLPRLYRVPADLLAPDGANTLLIRVMDAELSGGILDGPVALVLPGKESALAVSPVADLAGTWRLRPGDDPAFAREATPDSAWATATVPARWDAQGLAGIDGIAWYRRRFTLAPADAGQDLTLVLGAVDDLDEVYVNGTLVGRTGNWDRMGNWETLSVDGDEWQTERAYAVPARVLRAGPNTIAVRVYDALLDGGITRGPVALYTPEAAQTRLDRLGR